MCVSCWDDDVVNPLNYPLFLSQCLSSCLWTYPGHLPFFRVSHQSLHFEMYPHPKAKIAPTVFRFSNPRPTTYSPMSSHEIYLPVALCEIAEPLHIAPSTLSPLSTKSGMSPRAFWPEVLHVTEALINVAEMLLYINCPIQSSETFGLSVHWLASDQFNSPFLTNLNLNSETPGEWVSLSEMLELGSQME